MPSLKDLLHAMSASWPVALAILLGALGTLVGYSLKLPFLAGLPSWVFGTAYIVCVCSAAILVVTCMRGFVSGAGRWMSRGNMKKAVQEHADGILSLPIEELHVLVWAAVNNRQVFLAPFNHERLEPLVAKSYLDKLSGTHSVLDWPYRIPDHVWKSLRAQVAEMPSRSEVADPFARGW